MSEPILRAENLKTYFKTFNGTVKAVDDVSFELKAGEILAIVGESGSGKSVCVKNLMGLNSSKNTVIEGSLRLQNRDGNLLDLSNSGWRRIRGREIGMIFQEPMSSFDPLSTVGAQALEAYLAHYDVSSAEARETLIGMFRKVRIPEAEQRFDEYPHQLSGGMLQRIMIATVLSCHPGILIADEPTTALDVTIQAQILRLMKDLQAEINTSIIFITHDLGVVGQVADRVIVMYAGKIVEQAGAEVLFTRPVHPYTRGLLKSRVKKEFKGQKLPAIPGMVPRPFEFPDGCRFNPRCPEAMEICKTELPELKEVSPGHGCGCWLHSGLHDKKGAES